jgi:hypothetical protein
VSIGGISWEADLARFTIARIPSFNKGSNVDPSTLEVRHHACAKCAGVAGLSQPVYEVEHVADLMGSRLSGLNSTKLAAACVRSINRSHTAPHRTEHFTLANRVIDTERYFWRPEAEDEMAARRAVLRLAISGQPIG